MGGVGLGVQGQHAVAVEVEELTRMGIEEAAGYHGLGRMGVALGVEPGRRCGNRGCRFPWTRRHPRRTPYGPARIRQSTGAAAQCRVPFDRLPWPIPSPTLPHCVVAALVRPVQYRPKPMLGGCLAKGRPAPSERAEPPPVVSCPGPNARELRRCRGAFRCDPISVCGACRRCGRGRTDKRPGVLRSRWPCQ